MKESNKNSLQLTPASREYHSVDSFYSFCVSTSSTLLLSCFFFMMPSGDQPHGARSQKEHTKGEGSGPHLETGEGATGEGSSSPHLETGEGSGHPLETGPSSGGGKIKVQRQSWSPDEDEKLTELVQKYGTGKWTFISKKGDFDRTTNSCRKRWEKHLNPTIEKGELSADEKNKIALLHAQIGNQWSYIAKQVSI